MINFYLSYKWLHWTRPTGRPEPLPTGIERIFIQTPGGDLELLCAIPDETSATAAAASSIPPVVFAHGGMGSAWVWIPYMQYLQKRGIKSYAVSLRGHGASWHPSFLRMLYGTTKRALADDLLAAIRAVEKREEEDVVLVGHSSGGGLSQLILSEGNVKVKGLALLGAVPGSGSYRVYWNWWCFDPWFTIRMVFHGWHSNSPLSHPFLTRRAFFSIEYPEADLLDFQNHLARYESFLWPLGMMKPFVRAQQLLQNVLGWGNSTERILIMAGTGDKLMTESVQRHAAKTYRDAYQKMMRSNNVDTKGEEIYKVEGEGGMDDTGFGVRLAFVPNAGHHLQNDSQRDTGAAKLVAFLKQL
ncbi:Alpha/Beta hydrolase protein [Xylariales sp. PMI_506]|nr:Alpha/Beta hydrolase protein [Xylariales sp. PMI_506]